ncbi:hypothetical protein [Catalinimonas alkaloidigena]|uniref:hypothetical protein n=1 Tax=Catalinimonas alkaloidigena TaxID=1075417 RepID=UPI00115FACB5|nr:hypothetical protein [Catalinimonas alkaloidigena]
MAKRRSLYDRIEEDNFEQPEAADNPQPVQESPPVSSVEENFLSEFQDFLEREASSPKVRGSSFSATQEFFAQLEAMVQQEGIHGGYSECIRQLFYYYIRHGRGGQLYDIPKKVKTKGKIY